mgnify:CR=1 FL=1
MFNHKIISILATLYKQWKLSRLRKQSMIDSNTTKSSREWSQTKDSTSTTQCRPINLLLILTNDFCFKNSYLFRHSSTYFYGASSIDMGLATSCWPHCIFSEHSLKFLESFETKLTQKRIVIFTMSFFDSWRKILRWFPKGSYFFRF